MTKKLFSIAPLTAALLAIASPAAFAQNVISAPARLAGLVDESTLTPSDLGYAGASMPSLTPAADEFMVRLQSTDGSLINDELNGVLLWRGPLLYFDPSLPNSYFSQGYGSTIRPLPYNAIGQPMFVSSTEYWEWVDATQPVDPAGDTTDRLYVKFRRYLWNGGYPALSGEVELEGKFVCPPSRITPRSAPWLTVTHDPTTSAFTIYRLNADGGSAAQLGRFVVQRLVLQEGEENHPTVASIADGDVVGGGFQYFDNPFIRLGSGSDGSMVVRIVGPATQGGQGREADAVNVWINPTGFGGETYKQLPADTRRVLYVSSNRVLYETTAGQVWFATFYDGVYNPTTAVQTNLTANFFLLDNDNFTDLSGPEFLWAYNAATNSISCYRVSGPELVLEYTFAVPVGVFPAAVDIRDRPIAIKNVADRTAVISMPHGYNNVLVTPTGAVSLPNAPDDTIMKPMFVSAAEVVQSCNPQDQFGFFAGASVHHYAIAGAVATRTQVPLVEGSYVLSDLYRSPDNDYWYFNTVQNVAVADRTTALRVRTYRLVDEPNADNDNDGLLNAQEILLGTDPNVKDSDGDGLIDGREIYPYELVSGAYTWEQARADAKARGGRLATPKTLAEQSALWARLNRQFRPGQQYWIGGNDITAEGTYRWIKDDSNLNGAVFGYTNWDATAGYPNNLNNADAVKITHTGFWQDETASDRLAGYIIYFEPSEPRDPTDPSATTTFTGITTNGSNVVTNISNTTTPGSNVATNSVSLATLVANGTIAVGSPIRGSGIPDGTTITAIDVGANTITLSAAATVTASGVHLTVPLRSPFVRDTDGDGLTDTAELAIPTDIENPDTDGDGFVDGDEVRYGGDPLDESLRPGYDPTPNLLTYPNIRTSYTGTVRVPGGSPFGVMTMTIGRNGTFSYSADSLFGKGSGRGRFDAQGGFTANVNIFGRVATMDLYLRLGPATSPRPLVNVRLLDYATGEVIYYTQLLPLVPRPFGRAGTYTLASLPGLDNVGAGTGAAIGFVSVNSGGAVSAYGYTPDNVKYRFASRANQRDTGIEPVDASANNLVPVLARGSSVAGRVQLAGSIQLAPLRDRDIDGDWRMLRPATYRLVPFAEGYDEEREIQGSLYRKPGLYQMPIAGIPVTVANARIELSGGVFDVGEYPIDLGAEQPYIATWSPRGSIVAPTNTQYVIKGSQNVKNGEVSLTTTTFYTPGIPSFKLPMRLAVLQKQNRVVGFFNDPLSGGGAEMLYNVNGDRPMTILLSPTKKSVSGDGGVYPILVRATGGTQRWPLTQANGRPLLATQPVPDQNVQRLPQTLLPPPEAYDDAGNPVFDPDADINEVGWARVMAPAFEESYELYGTGTGLVTVEVSENPNDWSRRLSFRIGGILHELWQGPRPLTLIPAARTVPGEGAIYPVDVITRGAWTPVVPDDIDWVTVTPADEQIGRGGFVVTVAANTTTQQRTAVITVGTKTHVITQRPANVTLDPTSFSTYAEGGVLTINVTTTIESWTVDIPTNVTWVGAATANDPTADDGIIEGLGSTTVTLVVGPKADGLPYDRTATITIAGKLFKITQSRKLSSAVLIR